MKEEKFYNLFDKHNDSVFEALNALCTSIKDICKGNMEKAILNAQKVIELESKDDALVNELREELIKGALLKYSTEDYFMLVEAVERILDRSEIVARHIVLLENFPPPQEIVNLGLKMSETLFEASKIFNEALKIFSENFSKAMEKTKKVRELRDSIINDEFNLIKILINLNAECKTMMLYKDVFSLLARTSETIMNAANTLQTIIAKYSI
ncbi:MAG: DUF47 family protein [Candidatus Bathyarchaeia archaeon]|nr:DUF47 family protein [Candidatus Bathyarchaeota archaeon]